MGVEVGAELRLGDIVGDAEGDTEPVGGYDFVGETEGLEVGDDEIVGFVLTVGDDDGHLQTKNHKICTRYE